MASKEQDATPIAIPKQQKDGKAVTYNNPYTGELFETNFLSRSQMKEKIENSKEALK
jgi:hypothetical protein